MSCGLMGIWLVWVRSRETETYIYIYIYIYIYMCVCVCVCVCLCVCVERERSREIVTYIEIDRDMRRPYERRQQILKKRQLYGEIEGEAKIV